jgi:UDPglucose 6-dehydrogenase
MEAAVLGTGYVGLVTGACLASLGHRVICMDSDPAKLTVLNRGEIPIYEPGLPELVAAGQERGRLTFTPHLEEAVRSAEVIFICVGTPPLPDGNVDLTQVEAVARQIGATLDTGYRVIVNKSTVPVGSGDWVRVLIEDGVRAREDLTSLPSDDGGGLHVRSPGYERAAAPVRVGSSTSESRSAVGAPPSAVATAPNFDVVSNPEFLREGSAIADMLHPDRIVVGSDSPRALGVLRELYAPIIEQSFLPGAIRQAVPFVETDLASAEMIKYAANAFLATKVSFINEIANICERVGARVDQVAYGMGLDERIGSRFLNAGIGWGGSCFGKDVAALARMAADYGYEARILAAVQDVNAAQRQWVVQKLQERLKVLKGKTVGLLGLAFKAHTDDVRDAPAVTIARRLVALGVKVRGLDPVAGRGALAHVPELILVPDAASLADGADALVLMTEWPAFREIDYAALRCRMRHATFIDGRNYLDGERLRELGFDYWGIGL